MKVLFLDIDGVVNSTESLERNRCAIDPQLATIVRSIAIAIPDLKMVLSSSWRHFSEGRKLVEQRLVQCFDVTPVLHDLSLGRGYQIQAWLTEHPEVERYAIVDGDESMLEHQMLNFFQTSPEVGITQELANRVIAHFTNSDAVSRRCVEHQPDVDTIFRKL